MHPADNYDVKKVLLERIHEMFGPKVVVLEIVTDPESHESGCGCMGCSCGHEYNEEYVEGEDDDHPEGCRCDDCAGGASPTKAKAEARFEGLAQALSSQES